MNFLLLENSCTHTRAQKMTFNLDQGEGSGDEGGKEEEGWEKKRKKKMKSSS